MGCRVSIGTDAGGVSGNLGDSIIDLYANDCRTRLASDDDSGPGAYSLIADWVIPANSYYVLQVRGYNAHFAGAYKLVILCGGVPVYPANDWCAGAIPIYRGHTGTIYGDLSFARNNYDPGPRTGCTGLAAPGRDVTYYMDLQANDYVRLVYQISGGADASIYITSDTTHIGSGCVIGADSHPGGHSEDIDWLAPATRRYYVICDVYRGGDGRDFTLDYDIHGQYPSGVASPVKVEGGEGILALTPNPFNRSTEVRYVLGLAGRVRLEIFDPGGRCVQSVDGGAAEAGVHSILWNGCGPNGSSVAPGVYFVRLSDGRRSWTRPVIRIR